MNDIMFYLIMAETFIMGTIAMLGDYMYRKRNIKTKLTVLIHDIIWIDYDDEDEE